MVRPWFRKKGFVIPAAVIAGLIVIGGIGSALSPAKQQKDVAATASNSTSPAPASTTSSHSSAAKAAAVQQPSTKHSAEPARKSHAAAGDGSFTMPNEQGKILQDAQDDIQRVSGDPVFFSHSHDLHGDRFQILDRDWKVCTQNVSPGTRVSAVGHIDFGVVKVTEECP